MTMIPRTLSGVALLLAATAMSGCDSPPPPQTSPPPAAAPEPAAAAPPVLEDAVAEEPSLARNFYFIIDGSGSMLDEPDMHCRGDRSFGSKIEGAKWAVHQFMEHVPNDVYLGLWVFDRRGSREVVPLAADNREAFLAAVDAMSADGATPLARAIREGADRLGGRYKRQLGYGEFRLVVVTDGLADGLPGAADYAAKLGIPIYTIGLCIRSDHPLRELSVSYRAADSMEDLAQGLKETMAETERFDVTVFEELNDPDDQP
jgi:hypothetical protein